MTPPPQAAAKAAANPVGSLVEAEEGSEVTWPNGTRRKVTGGYVALDSPGVFTINGQEVEAT